MLQVHDELVLEVPEGSLDDARNIVKKEMEEAVSLCVPLVVDTERVVRGKKHTDNSELTTKSEVLARYGLWCMHRRMLGYGTFIIGLGHIRRSGIVELLDGAVWNRIGDKGMQNQRGLRSIQIGVRTMTYPSGHCRRRDRLSLFGGALPGAHLFSDLRAWCATEKMREIWHKTRL